MFADRDPGEAAGVVEVAPLRLEADERIAEGLVGDGERLAFEAVGGGVLEGLFLAADRVEAEGEVIAEPAVHIQLVAVGPLAALLEHQRAEVLH